MALLDFKRTDIQRATAERRRAHLEQVVVLFRLYAFITIALAVSAALSAVFIVPLLYTQAQYAQNELQDDVDFCLQRTATLNVRVDMLDGRRVKRNLAKRKRKKPSASDYAEFDRPPGISPAKISSRRIEAHGTQTHNGAYEFGDGTMDPYVFDHYSGYGSPVAVRESCCSCGMGPIGEPGGQGPDGEPGLDGRPGRNGRNGVDALPGQQTTEEDFCFDCPRAPAGFPGVPGLKGPVGDPGLPGEPGTTHGRGPPGVQGKMGVQGKPGRDGPPGERGRPGKLIIVDGPIGAPGPRGIDGLPGVPGSPGSPGSAGLQGPPGPAGEEGEVGEPGSDGLPGNPGFPGVPGGKGSCRHCPIPKVAPGYYLF